MVIVGEGCGRRCCRRGRQRGDIRAACVRWRRSTKSSPITWAMTSTIRPGAVSTTVLVNALSTPSAVSANETPPCPDGSHHLTCGRRLLRCRRADHRHIIVGTGCRCHSPHGFGHRGPFPPSSRPACRATYTDFRILPEGVPMTFHLSLSSGSERIGRRRGLNGDPSGVGVGLDVGCGGAEAR